MISFEVFSNMAGTLPILNFQFGQIPKFFQTTEFFTLLSQIITEILGGLSSGFIAAIVDGIFGVTTA